MSQDQKKLHIHAVLPQKFFGYNKYMATMDLEIRRSVNVDWYTKICLLEVINELRKTN